MSMLKKDFLNKMEETLGKETFKKYLLSFNEKTKHGLYINLRKLTKSSIDLDFLLKKFKGELIYKNDKFAYMTYDKEALLKKDIYPGKDPLYHAGLYYIQEPSAAKVLFEVKIEEDDKVLDLCASPGGKSCMALMSLNKKKGGFLIANDIDFNRAKTLSSNIERMGFDNAIVTCNTPKDLSEKYEEYFDKVIVDAPCSGEGMFRKSDEASTDWSLEVVKSCSKMQKEILDEAYKMVRKGGMLIYSTCTFSKEEDEDNVSYILDKYKDLKLLHSEKQYPFDGFGEGQFFSYFFKGEGEKIVLDFPTEDSLKGLNVLRYGLILTEKKGKGVVPAHAITHNDDNTDIKDKIELDDEDIIKYLHGETIRGMTYVKGYCVITYKNLGVGLAKVSDGVVKNHYPKGLRLLY